VQGNLLVFPTRKEVMDSSPVSPSRYIRSREELRRRWVQILEWDVKNTKINLNRLVRRNRTSRQRVVAAQGPIVSLTTHGRRVQTVYLTVESIAAGSELPSRLILWLDDEAAYQDLPASLRRLQERGLEVRLSRNYGPHTKYYPFLESTEDFDSPLVTADDDTIYPGNWLRGLRRSYVSNPAVVSCYRAHVVKFSNGRLAPYLTWDRCHSNLPSFRYFATGVSGCLYPPKFLKKLKEAGRRFEQVCPKADDLWLHVNAIRAGYKIKQVHPWQMIYPLLPDTQDIGLLVSNVHGSHNDLQIQHTYTQSDVDMLRSESV